MDELTVLPNLTKGFGSDNIIIYYGNQKNKELPNITNSFGGNIVIINEKYKNKYLKYKNKYLKYKMKYN
jgi:hypothetical protein